MKDLDNKLMEDEKRQFEFFYESLKDKNKKEWIQQNSLDTWILMDACNDSAIKKEKVSVKKLKEYYYN